MVPTLTEMLADRVTISTTAVAWSMPNTTRFVVTGTQAAAALMSIPKNDSRVKVLECSKDGMMKQTAAGAVLGDSDACVAFWRLMETQN